MLNTSERVSASNIEEAFQTLFLFLVLNLKIALNVLQRCFQIILTTPSYFAWLNTVAAKDYTNAFVNYMILHILFVSLRLPGYTCQKLLRPKHLF